MERLGKAIIGGAVTEIRALPDRGSNCVVHMLWEGDILQHTRFWKGCELPQGFCSSYKKRRWAHLRNERQNSFGIMKKSPGRV